MIDRLRMFLNRPLRDAERRRLFVAAVAVILAGAAALGDCSTDRPRGRSARRAARRPRRLRRSPPPSRRKTRCRSRRPARRARPARSSRAPAPTSRPRSGRRGASWRVISRTRTAGGSARRIASASVQLRRRLAAQPPRVPARERHRHPRVVLVQSNGVGRVRAELVALIRDGARRYTVPAQLTRGRAGWKVTAVGS